MKKIPSIIILFLAVVCSCKKNADVPNYFGVQIGDQSFTFDSIYASQDSSSPFAYFASIVAWNTKDHSWLAINTISSPKTTILGTYIYTPGGQSSSTFNSVSLSASIASGTLQGLYSATEPFSLTLNSSDNNIFQGSFSGPLYPPIDTGSGNPLEILQISGQFKIHYEFVP